MTVNSNFWDNLVATNQDETSDNLGPIHQKKKRNLFKKINFFFEHLCCLRYGHDPEIVLMMLLGEFSYTPDRNFISSYGDRPKRQACWWPVLWTGPEGETKWAQTFSVVSSFARENHEVLEVLLGLTNLSCRMRFLFPNNPLDRGLYQWY